MYGCRLEEGCNASVSKSRATARICTLGDSGMLASKNSSQQLKKARRANKECSNVPMAPSPCRPTSYADPPSEDEPRLYEEHGRTPAHRKSKLPHQPTTDKFEPKMLRDRTSPARRPAAAAEASRRRSRGQSGRTGSPGSWRGRTPGRSWSGGTPDTKPAGPASGRRRPGGLGRRGGAAPQAPSASRTESRDYSSRAITQVTLALLNTTLPRLFPGWVGGRKVLPEPQH